ncbi:MAG: hypothetical protein U5K84_02805 [Alkalibacterium sp.]|nr:hypothetical protein [Alkalibacterium sp.]
MLNLSTASGVSGYVELKEPAQKVVALEWTYAEDLLVQVYNLPEWRI